MASCPRRTVRSTSPGSMRLTASIRPMCVVTWMTFSLGRGQHHRHLLDPREVGEEFGVSGEEVAARVQRLLVERRGADTPAPHRSRRVRRRPRTYWYAASPATADSCPQGRSAGSSPRSTTSMRPALNSASAGLSTGTISQLSRDRSRLAQALRVADDDGAATAHGVGMEQRGDDHLGADAGAVAHGDRDERERRADRVGVLHGGGRRGCVHRTSPCGTCDTGGGGKRWSGRRARTIRSRDPVSP